MPSSSATRKTEDVLEKVLRTIREEYENPFPVLCEMDRNRFVSEEESLREQLRQTVESDPDGWRGFLCLPSPQAVKCLQEAEELHQRIKTEINAKIRARLTGKSNPPSPSNNGRGSVLGSRGAGTPQTSSGLSISDDNPEPASEITKSPRNLRYFVSQVSESNANSAIRSDHDHTPNINIPLETSSESGDRSSNSSIRRHGRSPPPPPLRRVGQSGNLSETSSQSSNSPRRSQSVRNDHDHTPNINIPLETSSESGDRSSNSSIRRHRRSPPPPPLRRVGQSGNSSETSSQSSDSPRRSQSVRRPAPPPPQSPRQSNTPRSPIITCFSPHGASSLDPAMIASLSGFAQQMSALAPSIASGALSKQPQGRHRSRGSESYISKTNCVDISGSNVEGLTMNNGGTNNSGAVIHKMAMPPPRLPQHVPPAQF